MTSITFALYSAHFVLTFARIPTASLPITVTTALINKTSLSKFIYISSIIPHSGDFAKSFNYKYFINVGKSVLWVEGQGRWFAVNETGEHCSPLPIFVRITKKFVKKSKTLKCKKAGCQISAKQKKFDERDVNFCELASRNFAAPLQKTPPFRGRSWIIFLF